jgi:Flp pilus assembly protein TadD
LLIVSLNETSARLREQKRYKAMVVNLSLVVEVRPDSPQAHLSLARAQALSGNKKQALESIQKAVELGWNDAAQLNSILEFESIRADPAYKQLLERLSRKS